MLPYKREIDRVKIEKSQTKVIAYIEQLEIRFRESHQSKFYY